MCKINIIEEYPLEMLYSKKFRNHHRLKVFVNKGTRCVTCGCEGTRLIKHRVFGKKSFSDHVDLFTADLRLMTVDHIKPKCLHGGESLKNKQTMCSPCNTKKGFSYTPPTIEKIHGIFCIIKEFLGIFTDLPGNYRRSMQKRINAENKKERRKLKHSSNNNLQHA